VCFPTVRKVVSSVYYATITKGSFIHKLQTFSNSTIKKWGPYTNEKVVLQIYYAETVYSLCIAFLCDAKKFERKGKVRKTRLGYVHGVV